MKYHIWDNDNAVMVCTTDSRKEAFTAILNHLIEANASEVPDPIMWPVADVNSIREDGWSLIRQAEKAYNRIVGFIPMP